ncbi:uncharacterized protein FFUJ_11009 [Fusarium fujikuroi IMI 58289]|uniref:Uncharacterized protein n=1 Tax=Gibberella fujikuroi (strain CBS 195.34 / IMI 58289 / NRRL A-6831) TaxID=1279085 RepID=S0EJW7_GIBF5|nr:uncharacterized protein FFUJ_11009 [Fusarium fujikuroi IMI 58289]CCT74935.1 uncharacterized protein FFUJ_11009 [Fusarium fujikuroi IMI 58289]SCO04224.1 uncharacterized protein FFM5_08243 [Fusarium fujikuroi]
MAQYEAILSTDTTDLPSGSPEQDMRLEETTPPPPGRYESFREADAVSLPRADTDFEPALLKTAHEENVSGKSQPPGPISWNKYAKHRWWHKIGLLGLITLMAGTLSFATATKVITICSAAIRVSIGLHISLVAAAVAALMLETTGTRFCDVAAVSIQRASGSSPYTILPASLRLTRLSTFGVLHASIMILGTIILVASTFTSTILLTDLKNVNIAGPTQTKLLPIRLGPNTTLSANGVLHYRSSPSANWRFGEMKSGNVASTAEIADTGNTYRVLLPYMKEESRTTLEHYSGPGLVSNFRTVCFSPNLERIRFGLTASKSGLQTELDIRSTKNGPEFLKNWSDSRFTFYAQLPTKWNESDRATLPLSLANNFHAGPRGDLGLQDHPSGRNFTFIPLMLLKSSPILLRGFGHLDLGGETDESEAMDKIDQLKGLKTNMDGRWTIASLKNGTQVLSATLCFVADNAPELYEITMTGMTIPSEPTVGWQRNGTSKSSAQLQKQLGIGVSYKDYRDRHIMQLKEPRNLALIQALLGYSPQGGWATTNYKDLYEEDWIAWWAAHAVHVSLIQDILRVTGDPALAIQALAFRFHSMIFYDSITEFDLYKPVTTISSVEMLISVRWTGLAVVLSLILVHLLLLCSTMVLFQLKTRASGLGNAWQAIAQVVSTETRAVMEEASAVRDKEVEAWARSSGVSRRSYAVSMSDVRNRMEIMEQKL